MDRKMHCKPCTVEKLKKEAQNYYYHYYYIKNYIIYPAVQWV